MKIGNKCIKIGRNLTRIGRNRSRFGFPKVENLVYRYIFHAYGMDNKKGKEKTSTKNED
jgi:hypothetical protein